MNRHLDFMIIGVPRAGTTSLAYWLSQHPEICFSKPKEPRYLDSPAYNLDHYFAKYFKCEDNEKLGEGTPFYIFLPFMAKRIKSLFPNVKLLVILREPIARAYSDWWFKYIIGTENKSFADAIKEDIDNKSKFELNEDTWYTIRDRKIKYRAYIEIGLYSKHLSNYYTVFDKNNIKVIIFEELIREPKDILREIFSFLNINSSYYILDNIKLTPQNASYKPSTRKILHTIKRLKLNNIIPSSIKSLVGRYMSTKSRDKLPKIPADINTMLQEYYREYNKELEKLLGRKLPSNWYY